VFHVFWLGCGGYLAGLIQQRRVLGSGGEKGGKINFMPIMIIMLMLGI
jgi:hypothetical protein